MLAGNEPKAQPIVACLFLLGLRVRHVCPTLPAPYFAGRRGALHSLVVRQLWELDVGGSNPSAPTTF